MKPEDIHLSDWMRILVGEVPGSFYIEAFFRIVFIYLLLIVSMRLMGNRMGKPLTRNELIAMVSLAAANGVALMAADRGLLPVVLIAAIVIGYQRWIATRATRNARFESLVLDDLSILVEDGRLNLDKLEEGVLSRNQVFAKLRQESVKNLGQVRRAYQEANGDFAIFTFEEEEPRPGLSIVPATDTAFRQEQQKAAGQHACGSCGHVLHSAQAPNGQCPHCGQQQWQPAVLGA
jgi:uncharacterized membrane protein YcaP (DUF421 family)